MAIFFSIFVQSELACVNCTPLTTRGVASIFAARCYASAAYAIMRCVSVCVCLLSVTLVLSVKTNKHIFKLFSPSGSHTILVFQYQSGWQYSDGNSPNGGVECGWGRQKSQF